MTGTIKTQKCSVVFVFLIICGCRAQVQPGVTPTTPTTPSPKVDTPTTPTTPSPKANAPVVTPVPGVIAAPTVAAAGPVVPAVPTTGKTAPSLPIAPRATAAPPVAGVATTSRQGSTGTQKPPLVPVAACAKAPTSTSAAADAKIADYSFVVALVGTDSPSNILCGGVLIEPNWVLTTASCVGKKNVKDFAVRFGDEDLTSTKDDTAAFSVNPAKIVSHPSYSQPSVYNDIALVKLSRAITESTIKPACLPAGRLVGEDKQLVLTTVGYGSQANKNAATKKIGRAEIEVGQSSSCQRDYADSTSLPTGIIRSLICAGNVAKGKDVCKADLGSPLIQVGQDQSWTVVGLSTSGKECGKFLGLYTRVSSFYDWIRGNAKN